MCPIYDFSCVCKNIVKNELVRTSEDIVRCPSCGEVMFKIYNFAPTLHDPNKVYPTNREQDVDDIFENSQF